MNPQASVIIPTYNREAELERVLSALEKQEGQHAFEVFVVDDGSADGTSQVLSKQRLFPLTSLRQDNAGPAAARNAGIRQARGDVVIFIDDDVIPDSNLILEHLDTQASRRGVVIGALRPPRTRQPAWAEWECQTLARQYELMLAGVFAPTPRQFYTANASVPRKSLLQAGLFDADFKRAEDVEIAYRLQDLGLPFTFNDRAIVQHDTPRSFCAWSAIAESYGHHDVLMWRAGRRHILRNIADEFEGTRHPATKALARAVVGRGPIMSAVRSVGGALIRTLSVTGPRPAALKLCGAYFNTLYMDAACRDLGGRSNFWAAVRRELDGETVMVQPVRGS
jgi:glycosyltransferase involved in cell wall biosynthesis